MSRIVKNNLGFDSDLVILQDKEMFNYSIDTILLGNFLTITKKTKRILDIGTNNGALAIFVAARKDDLIIDAVEIQARAVDLAKKNIELNDLNNQIYVFLEDFNSFYLKHNQNQMTKYDAIVCNPPFYRLSTGLMRKGASAIHLATHEIALNLEQIVQGASKIIQQKGMLAMVLPPERLVDLFVLLRKYNFEPKRVQFVYPREKDQPVLVLVEARFQTGWGTKFLPNIYLHERDNTKHVYRKEVIDLYKPKRVSKE